MKNQSNFSDYFSKADLFKNIDKDQYSEIIAIGHFHTYESDTIVFWEGDPALHCYLVITGHLKLSKLHEDGKEAIVRYIGSGEVTAAVSVFSGKNYPVTAQAVGPAKTVAWDQETMRNLLISHPQLAVNMLHVAVERLDDLQSRYLELSAERVERRIARAVLRIMKHSGRKTDEGILIDFRLSRQDLADYTGTTLYTVSRALTKWEKKGWTASGRERIVITDPHALVAFSEAG